MDKPTTPSGLSAGLFAYPTTSPADPTNGLTLFADVPQADWAIIRRHCELRRFRSGERVVGEHDADPALWIIADGVFGLADRHGETELGPGAIFGELTFLTGTPDGVTVRALRDGAVLRLRLADLDVLAGLQPVVVRRLLFDLARLLAVRLRDLRRSVER